jgi:predicted ATPase/signal transduction histidine kinase
VELPGYKNFREIFSGARSVVYRANRSSDETPVVIKTVLTDRPGAAQSAELLRHEYEVLTSLDMPAVVKPLGLEDALGWPALVLPDAGPENLHDWLRRRSVGTYAFLDFAIQIATIAVYLYGRNVIHRDINPLNLVVGPNQRLTLVDFDAATTVSGLGVRSELEGTLRYISPEQTGRMNRLVDHRSDLYAIGATFYELLTGSPPFQSPDPIELVHAHLARAPLPPSEINLAVPTAISDLVLKLLEKVPEQRYQTAEALLADLNEAQRQFSGSGTVSRFELGLIDFARQLPLPDKLYGRDREISELYGALERVSAGARELMLVTGPPGIGKSVLVERLRRPTAEKKGWFVYGKVDLPHGDVPYAPLVEAFRSLVVTLLSESKAELGAWRMRLQTAVGQSGRVITALIPELERLIGEQPPLAKLGPVETENRFHLVFQAFVRALATSEHPLVVFIDDVQWTDAASLALLRVLATAPDMRYLLLIGALRPVAGQDPSRQAIVASRAGGAVVHEIELPALDIDSLTTLCCDVLRCDPARGRPLAELVLRKTAGNPFFVKRLLRMLHQSGLLRFDSVLSTWEWDLGRIESVGVTDNVVDLLVGALRRLPEPTQNVLKIAACIGSRFDLDLLAGLQGESIDATARRLWTAIREGLIVPLDPSHSHESERPRYQFAHDRVQQVAYSLLGADEREDLHLRIGRRLSEGLTEEALDERLFEVVDQLNLGADRVADEAERFRFARLNSRAAFKAKGSSAYGSALDYFRRATALLPKDAWQSHHDFVFLVHKEAVECAYLTSPALADELYESARQHAESHLEKASLCGIRVAVCTTKGLLAEAIRWGREGLALFGLALPETGVKEAALAEVQAVQATLAGRPIQELLRLDHMGGADDLACMQLLSRLISATYMSEPELFAFVAARMVNLSLTRGHAIQSPYAYVSYGLIIAWFTGDYAAGQAFGRLAVELSQRFGNPVYESIALGTFGGFLNFWRSPLRASVPLLRQAVVKGLESGRLQNVIYFRIAIVTNLFHQGVELSRILAEIEAGLALAKKTNVPSAVEWQLAHRQAIRCLQGHTRDRNRFDDAEFDEATHLAGIAGDPFITCLYEILRLETSYLFGDLALARKISVASSRRLRFMIGYVPFVEHNFYTSLTLAACWSQAPADEKRSLLEKIQKNQAQLEVWATNCPENFRHKHLLVEGELARIDGRPLDAGDLYDKAIEAARREGFLQDEALANELAGRFYRSLDRRRIAALYLSAAIREYARWGATAKAEALEEEFPDLESVESPSWRVPISPIQDQKGGAALDLLGILRAAETISSEVVLDRLLEKLMEVCLATAGGERGALLLEEEGRFVVRVVASVAESALMERTPIEICEEVPDSIVEHVRATGEVVVLANAAQQGNFSSDPYVASRSVKSALAVPIRRKAKLLGVLYLENNLATRVFSPDRVRVLQLLSAQIAISLENSLLFEERKRSEATAGFLARAGDVLVGSLNYETTLSRVAEIAVPFLADWCSVHVLDETGEMKRVATAHVDPEKRELFRESREHYVARWNAPTSARQVLEEGKPLLAKDVTEEAFKQAGCDVGTIDLLRRLGTRTAMVLPLRARGRTFGALAFGSGATDRRYEAADLALAEEFARRAAAAIDNARLYEDAREAIRARDEFLSIASHELYTPITSLQLLLQSLKSRRVASSPESRANTLEVADRQTKKLTKLISELLSVSRIRANRLDLKLEDVDMSSVVRDVAESFGNELIRLKSPLSIEADGPIVGRWDRTRLEQVVTNLLSNATRFGAGKPIEVTVESFDDFARLTVTDHGIGIPSDRLPRIFERFERAVSIREYGGLGLGLYIVREIVRALDGMIRVDSKVGAGSTFTVELPRTGPGAQDRRRQRAEANA